MAAPGADLGAVARGMLETGDAGVLLEDAPADVVAAAARDLEAQLTERADADGVHLGGRVHLLLAVRRVKRPGGTAGTTPTVPPDGPQKSSSKPTDPLTPTW